MIGAIVGILGSLISIALAIGASDLADKMETARNTSNEVDSDSILKYINELVSTARNKGNRAISILNNRLSAIQLPLGVSPNVKEAIMDARRDLSSMLNKTQDKMSNIETTLNNAEQRANTLAAQPESVRRVVGSQTKKRIETDLQPALEQVNQIEKEVENYVSKQN